MTDQPMRHADHILPGQRIKSVTEDPDAPRRVQAILSHPHFRQADQDMDFLNLDSSRDVRLQLDYQKAQSVLEQQGVEHTIVVFGSTRLSEPVSAQLNVEKLQRELQTDSDNVELQRCLKVAQRRMAKSHYYNTARELGRLIGTAGVCPEDCRVTLMTGGGPGVMEAANRGAFDVGARSIGLNITLPHEQYPNPYITPELCFRFHYFAMRKLHFLLRARALVAFPGGYGTFDELFETLTLIQTRKMSAVPIVLVGEEYWRRAVDFDYMVEEGVIEPADRKLFWYAETAQDIWQGILEWHQANDTPLF
ncbi:MAG: TIGR00730 family Rossman fold protein [Steroidobacteraceae bacterium]